VALLPPPLTLPLLPRCLQAATNIALLHCRHRCSLRTAATALPLSRCALPLCFALPPPPLKLLPPPHRRHAAADVTLALLVDCYNSIDSDAFLSPHPTPFLSIHPQITPYCACHTNHNKTLCGVVVVLTNPMDCTQTKRMRHLQWCVDDAYALGWSALMPHAAVWAKAAPTPWLR
jgi:hypothetical protein